MKFEDMLHAKCTFCLALAANARLRHEGLHHKANYFSKSSQKELMEILLVSSSQYLQNQVALDLRSGGQVGYVSC